MTQEIMKELDRKPIKKPWNLTILAIIAADVLFCSLDAGSGFGVSYVTGFWYYGALVFLAGILPLLLWQALYKNGWANDTQRMVAAGGAFFAILSVVVVSAGVGIARFLLDNPVWAEIGLVLTLTIFATIHALLFVLYFYMDEQVTIQQQAVQQIGRAEQMIRKYEVAETVLQAADRSASRRQELEKKYSPEAVRKAQGEDFTPGQ